MHEVCGGNEAVSVLCYVVWMHLSYAPHPLRPGLPACPPNMLGSPSRLHLASALTSALTCLPSASLTSTLPALLPPSPP